MPDATARRTVLETAAAGKLIRGQSDTFMHATHAAEISQAEARAAETEHLIEWIGVDGTPRYGRPLYGSYGLTDAGWAALAEETRRAD